MPFTPFAPGSLCPPSPQTWRDTADTELLLDRESPQVSSSGLGVVPPDWQVWRQGSEANLDVCVGPCLQPVLGVSALEELEVDPSKAVLKASREGKVQPEVRKESPSPLWAWKGTIKGQFFVFIGDCRGLFCRLRDKVSLRIRPSLP